MPENTDETYIYQVVGTLPLEGLVKHGVEAKLVEDMLVHQKAWRDAIDTPEWGLRFTEFAKYSDQVNNQFAAVNFASVSKTLMLRSFLNTATCSAEKPLSVSVTVHGGSCRVSARLSAQVFVEYMTQHGIIENPVAVEHRRPLGEELEFDELERPSTGYVFTPGRGWALDSTEFMLFDGIDEWTDGECDEDEEY